MLAVLVAMEINCDSDDLMRGMTLPYCELGFQTVETEDTKVVRRRKTK